MAMRELRLLAAVTGVGAFGVASEPQRFGVSGRVVELEGAECRDESPGPGRVCRGAMGLRIDGREPTLHLSTLLFHGEVPLAVGPVDGALNGRAPAIVLADFDEDGLEDVAVAASRDSGYGRTAYAIHLVRDGEWRHFAVE